MKMALLLGAFVLAAGCGKKSDDETTTTSKSTLSLKGGSSLSLAADTKKAAMTIYEFLVSKSTDCSSPISVYKNDTGKLVDMNVAPDIGSGDLDNGTYPCVMMVMSDNITFTPKTTTGSCTADTEYTIDVFRPQGETYKPAGKLPDGTAVTGTTEKQKMAVYISTLSTSTGGDSGSNPFEAPTSAKATNGIKLTSSLVVTANTTGTLVLDTSGKVDGSSTNCDMQPPKFGFK